MSTAHNAAKAAPMFFLRAPEPFLNRQRLTDCCGTMSTYSETATTGERLCCKKCWREVSIGQGDGCSFLAVDGVTLLVGPLDSARNAELGTTNGRPVVWVG